MKKSKIAETLLKNFNVEITEEKLFVIESLLESKRIRRMELLNSLILLKGLSNYQARMLLQSLNKKEIVKWTVDSGIATIKLTSKAEAEIFDIEVESLKNEVGEEAREIFSNVKKHVKKFLSSAEEKGKEFGNKATEEFADCLSHLADELRKSKK